jgi:hypothetical protein
MIFPLRGTSDQPLLPYISGEQMDRPGYQRHGENRPSFLREGDLRRT